MHRFLINLVVLLIVSMNSYGQDVTVSALCQYSVSIVGCKIEVTKTAAEFCNGPVDHQVFNICNVTIRDNEDELYISGDGTTFIAAWEDINEYNNFNTFSDAYTAACELCCVGNVQIDSVLIELKDWEPICYQDAAGDYQAGWLCFTNGAKEYFDTNNTQIFGVTEVAPSYCDVDIVCKNYCDDINGDMSEVVAYYIKCCVTKSNTTVIGIFSDAEMTVPYVPINPVNCAEDVGCFNYEVTHTTCCKYDDINGDGSEFVSYVELTRTTICDETVLYEVVGTYTDLTLRTPYTVINDFDINDLEDAATEVRREVITNGSFTVPTTASYVFYTVIDEGSGVTINDGYNTYPAFTGESGVLDNNGDLISNSIIFNVTNGSVVINYKILN